jgi:hypothetical protein
MRVRHRFIKNAMIIDEDLVARIEEWRREQPDLPNRSEAVRQLVTWGREHYPRGDQAWADAQSKSGCDETALVLTTELQWDCRETASVVLTTVHPAAAKLLPLCYPWLELYSISLGAHRCLSRNIAGMTATKWTAETDSPAENSLL